MSAMGYHAIVTFVSRITFLRNWSNITILQNIRKISTFYEVIENFRESMRVYLIRVVNDFNRNVFKCTKFIFR